MEKGLVDVQSLPVSLKDPQIVIWQGDITCIKADAIVNAANASLLGCFHPCHGCIDNAIHSAAGFQLRLACKKLMDMQGTDEPEGQAKVTPGFNLPAKFVIHTVGPMVKGPLSSVHCHALESCYRSCLLAAAKLGLQNIVFCCISTGVFQFPNVEAAKIAVTTVRELLSYYPTIKRVVFNVFQEIDKQIYTQLLA